MALMTLKVILILFPHLTRHPISPLVGSEHLICYQFSSRLLIIHLGVKHFIVICTNLFRVVLPDEVVKCCKRRWNEGLNGHVTLWWWKVEDSKAPLEDPKDPLNDIAS